MRPHDFSDHSRYYNWRTGGSRANQHTAEQRSWRSGLAGKQVWSSRETIAVKFDECIVRAGAFYNG